MEKNITIIISKIAPLQISWQSWEWEIMSDWSSLSLALFSLATLAQVEDLQYFDTQDGTIWIGKDKFHPRYMLRVE